MGQYYYTHRIKIDQNCGTCKWCEVVDQALGFRSGETLACCGCTPIKATDFCCDYEKKVAND